METQCSYCGDVVPLEQNPHSMGTPRYYGGCPSCGARFVRQDGREWPDQGPNKCVVDDALHGCPWEE